MSNLGSTTPPSEGGTKTPGVSRSAEAIQDKHVPLSRAEINLLRKEIRKDFVSVGNNLSEEELSLKVEAALPLAMIQKRAYDKAIKAFNMNFEQSKNLALTIKKYLDASQKLPEGNVSAKPELRRAGMALKRFTGDIEVKLTSANEEASLAWFGKTVVQTLAKLSQVQEQFDSLKIDYEMEIDRHGLDGKAKPKTPIKTSEKTPAKDYDVSKLVICNFAGKKKSISEQKNFLSWKEKWVQVKHELETKCEGVTEDILFEKLRKCLSGRALGLANAATSYAEAFEELCSTYDDKIRLFFAYLQRLISGSNVIAHQQAGKDVLCQIEELAAEFAQEEVSPEDFLSIHIVSKSMAPSALNGWRAFVRNSREEYIQSHKQAQNLKDNPWKLGYVINRISFNSWYEKWVCDHKDEVGQSSTNSAPTSKIFMGNECFLHKNADHSISQCTYALRMTIPEWKQACKAASRCSHCTKPLCDGHSEECVPQCSICNGVHHDMVCSANPARSSLKKSQEEKTSTSKDQPGHVKPVFEKPKCIIHNSDDHPTNQCKTALSMKSSDWIEACKIAGMCSLCTSPYYIGHRSVCVGRCIICGGMHHEVLCYSNPARAALTAATEQNTTSEVMTKASKCIIHDSADHSTVQCKTALAMKTNEWIKACKNVGLCSLCLCKSYYGHREKCSYVCSFCNGKHHEVNCSSNPARASLISTFTPKTDSKREETRKRANMSLVSTESPKKMKPFPQSYTASQEGNCSDMSYSERDPNKAREFAMSPLELLKLYSMQNKKITCENDMINFDYVSFPKGTKTNFKMTRHNELEDEFYTLDALVNFVSHMHKSHSDYIFESMHIRNIMIVRQQDRQNLFDYITGKIYTCSNLVGLSHFQLNPGQFSSKFSGPVATFRERKSSSHANVDEWKEWSNTGNTRMQQANSRLPPSNLYSRRSDFD